MSLSSHFMALQVRNGYIGGQAGLMRRPRRTVKFCKACGGKHAGLCSFEATGHGTRCRTELVESVERRHLERG